MPTEEVNFTAQFDDSQVTAALERLASGVDSVQDDLDKMSDTGSDAFTEVGKAANAAEKNMAGYAKSTMKAKERTAEAEKSQLRFRDAIRETVGELEVGGRTLSEWVALLKAKRAALKGVNAGIGGTNKLLRVFKVALASTGVGLIVVALGSLVALLTQTQKGIDFVNRVMAGLTTTINVIVDRLAIFGEGVVQLFRGEFSEAVDTFKGSVSGLGDELARENKITQILERDKVKLRDRQRELNREFAQGRARIEELRLAAEDESKSTSERQAALREAIKLEQDLGKQRIDIAEENLRIVATENALRGENQRAEDLDRLAAAETALAEIREDVAGKQQEDFAALQQLAREEQARIAALRAEYRKFLDELEGRAEAANISQLAGVERLQAEKEVALREIEAFRKEVISAATAAGQALPAGFQDDVRALIDAVEAEFRKEVQALRGDTPLIEPLDLLGGNRNRRNFEQEGRELMKATARGAENALPLIEELKNKILIALDINDAQLSAIAGAAQSVFGNITAGIEESTQAAINQQDALIDAIDNRINETERLLADEQRLREQGFANDVAGLQTKLEQETETRRQAEAERLELEKKAARQRLFQNSLEQASNFVLATLKLTAAEAGKGIVGIFTALAGLSLLTRIVSQSRAISQQFEPPKFRAGTEYVDGPGGGMSDLIHAMLSRGERIVPAALNEQIGGKSVSNEEMVKVYQVGNALSDSVNKSILPAVVSQAKRDNNRLEGLKLSIDREAMIQGYERAAMKSALFVVDYLRTRPVEKVDGDGNKVIEWQEGGKISRKKIRPGQP